MQSVRVEMYYTYAYLREGGTPYYIGKGKGNRSYRRRNKGIKPPKDKSRILILKQNLTEEESFRHEVYMIAVFGRKDLGTGILHNRTDGGEGASGWVPSEEWRENISKLHSGKIYDGETRKKISEARIGTIMAEETKIKISKAFKGKNNPNYGKKHSLETLKKMSEGTKGKNTKVRNFISPQGNNVVVDNLKDFCIENKLNYHCMINLHNGYGKSYKGWKKDT
jgi:hypothetical protein